MADTYAELQGPFRVDAKIESAYGTFEYAPAAIEDATYAEVVSTLTAVSVSSEMTREMSENLLRRAGMIDGNYVLRPSVSHPGSYVLCVAYERTVKHYPVELLISPGCEGQFLLLCPGERRRFSSLAEIISYYSFKAGGLATMLNKRIA